MEEIAQHMENLAKRPPSGARRRVRRLEKIHHHNYQFDPFEPPLRVVAAGVSRWREGDTFHTVNRRTFSMNVVTHGNALFDQEGARGSVGPGDVFLAHAGRTQYFTTGPASYLHKRFLLIDGPLLDTVLHSSGLLGCDVVRPQLPGRVIRLFSRAFELMRRKESAFTLQLSLVAHEILMELGRSISRKYPDGISRAIEFMKRHLDRNLTLDDISREARLSVRHCNRQFRRHLGLSPMQFFMNQRMEWGRSLLANTAMSVKEIATALGYEDPLYFSQRFHKHFGLSPRGYRTGTLPGNQ